jgi:hypothetical protein
MWKGVHQGDRKRRKAVVEGRFSLDRELNRGSLEQE